MSSLPFRPDRSLSDAIILVRAMFTEMANMRVFDELAVSEIIENFSVFTEWVHPDPNGELLAGVETGSTTVTRLRAVTQAIQMAMNEGQIMAGPMSSPRHETILLSSITPSVRTTWSVDLYEKDVDLYANLPIGVRALLDRIAVHRLDGHAVTEEKRRHA